MKKVLIGILAFILIAVIATGWFLRANIISFVNTKFGNGNDELIQSVLNVENNASISSFMDVQKATMEKKDYKNFSKRTSEEVTVLLKNVAKRLPGFDDLSNILFVEEGDNKRIDIINLNVYNKSLKQSYTAFVWESMPTTENPTWNGYFRINDNLLGAIDADLVSAMAETKESDEEVAKEITREEFIKSEEYASVVSYNGVSVIPEEDIVSAMSATFGANYGKVQNLYNAAKEAILLDAKASAMLGADEYGIGYGGKIDGDSYCVVVGSLMKDNVIGTNNYLLFKITTNGNYVDYSSTLKTLAKFNVDSIKSDLQLSTEPSSEESQVVADSDSTLETTIIPETTVVVEEMTTEVAESGGEIQPTAPKRNPTDLFEELLKEKEEESSAQNE